jgi:predicted alpha-1,2-mannosidase
VALLALTLVAVVAVDAPTPPPADAAEDFTPFVDPFVGTEAGAPNFGTGGGGGNTFPGAVVPFGMVQFSPDTWPGTANSAGYVYGERRIKGFGLTHFSGAGCDLLQDLPLMPTVAPLDRSPTPRGSASIDRRYIAAFSHSQEHASPGDYRVQLDPGTARAIGVELTASTHTGLARLRFPRSGHASVLFNAGGSKRANHEARVWVAPRRRQVAGMAESGRFCGRANSYRVWFVAQFRRGFRTYGTWRRQELHRRGTRAGDASPLAQAGAYATFDTRRHRYVEARIGLSFTSLGGARRNLAESSSGTFDQRRARARNTWAGALHHVVASGGTHEHLGIFYTALYHSLLHPNVVSDADGTALGLDGKLHRAAGRQRYGNYSGWDVYRGQQQLVAMLFPRRASDMAESLVDAARESDCLPRWSLASGHTNVMVGDPSDNVLSSAYAFGAHRFDVRGALKAMLRGARGPCHSDNGDYTEREGLADYLRQGYVGEEHDVSAHEHSSDHTMPWGAAATTLEYAAADFSISRLAAALGEDGAAREMLRRSANWRKVLRRSARYAVPRFSGGKWLSPYHPTALRGFVEGNGAQYTWSVPHDPAGLFAALGGPAKAAARLDRFFKRLNAGTHKPYAFLGNEPSLGVPWLYDWLGRPYRTQAVVRKTLLSLWSLTPGGMPGNDDGGAMSAWWVFGALGFYPAVPGEDILALGSPLFPHAVLSTARGKVTIDAPAAAAGRPYVSAATLGGRPLERPWLRFWQLRRAGTLGFTLGDSPDKSWGADPAKEPPSFEP